MSPRATIARRIERAICQRSMGNQNISKKMKPSQQTVLLLSSLIIIFVPTKSSANALEPLGKDVDRLRQMFSSSKKLATDSLHEHHLFRQLHQSAYKNERSNSSNKHDSSSPKQREDSKSDGHRTTNDSSNKDGSSRARFGDKDSEPDNVLGEGGQVEIGKNKASGLHSDARQSSLFSGLKSPFNPTFPTSLGANPLMNNLLHPPSFPTLPSLPTFPQATPKPPRPPKSSVIGNNGGSMALTNDNVVVVNVLSNNY